MCYSLTAYTLEQHGENDAHIISLDHSQEYTQKTQDLLTVHELETKAQVLYSPLEPTQVGNKTYSWYNIDRLTTKDTIDLLIIDGPPVKTNQLARYPALPLLFSKLSKACLAKFGRSSILILNLAGTITYTKFGL